MFNDKHEYMSFASAEMRNKYWIGRLVQAKTKVTLNLFESIDADTMGLVIRTKEVGYGQDYLLVVRWNDGRTVPCYKHSIYSYDGGYDNDKV